MIHDFEHAITCLQEASTLLVGAAHEGLPVNLNADQTAALAGAMLNLTRAATFVAQVEQN